MNAASSPPPSRFHPFRLTRAWRASVCALAAAVTLLLAAGAAEADSHTVPLTVLHSFACPACPAAPAGTAEPGPGAGEITLRWTWSQGTKPAVVGWSVTCSGGAGNPQHHRGNLGAGTRKHTCTNLKPGVQYHVWMSGHAADFSSSSVLEARLLPEDLVAKAGDDATVYAGARVTLDGTGSTGRSGATLSYAWRQTAGPTVRLDGATSAKAAFIAPRVSSQANLTFELTFGDGTSSEKDTVTVTVLPLVTGASVSGDELSVTFDSALNASATPASSAFTVTATRGGASRSIAGTSSLVTVSGKTVTATLSAAVDADETLTVRYDKPPSGAVLEDGAGTALPSFSSWPATHDDTMRPTVAGLAINGTTLTVTFNRALLESSAGIPDANRFTIGVAGSPATVSNVDVSGSTVTLTLGTAAVHGDEAVFNYSHPIGDNCTKCLQDLSGNKVRQVLGRSVTNNTPPAFASAAVVGDALTVTFNGGLATGSVPAADAFTVTVGGNRVALAAANPVAISGSTVTLNLAAPVLRVQTVTVGYTAPAVKPLQDADGANNPVPDFTGKAVTNNTPADTMRPTVAGMAINGTTLTVTFDEALLESAAGIPDANRFHIGVAGSPATVSNVDVSGSTVTLTLGTAAVHGDEAVFNYSHPIGDNCTKCLQDLSGTKVRQVQGRSVTNNTPPAFASAAVVGDALTVTFNGELATGSVPAADAFTVTVGGAEVELASANPVAISGTAVTLTLAESVGGSLPAVTVGYAAPAENPLRDADNAKLPVAGFTGKTVTNDTTVDTRRPTVSGLAINGTTMTVTFDEALLESVAGIPDANRFTIGVAGSPATVSNVDVSGSTVTLTLGTAAVHGDEAVFNYSHPIGDNCTKCLQDLSGNKVRQVLGRSVTNNTPPAFASAAVVGDALTVTFNGELAAGSVPAADAFTVTVGGNAVDLAATNPVAISGTAVTLTLAESVGGSLPAVTVGYAAPAAKPLRDADAANLPVAGFTGKTVANNTSGDTTPPTVSSAAINGRTLTLTFNEALDESSVPLKGAFRVGFAGALRTPAAVQVAGKVVTLTLDANPTVHHDQMVEVTYSKPTGAGAKLLRDLSENAVDSFVADNAERATNNTPPAFDSAAVVGDALTVTFNGALDPDSVPAADAFTVTVGGTEVDLAATNPVSISGTAVTLTLAESVGGSLPAVTVGYAVPAANPLRDADRAKNPVPDFTGKTVANNTSGDTTPPTVSSAAINGQTLTLTFNEALDESSVPLKGAFRVGFAGALRTPAAVQVAGKVVTLTLDANPTVHHDQMVEVTYSKPTGAGAKLLRDLSENAVDSFVADNAERATNNTPPAFSSATVNGDALTVTFDGALDPGSVPAADAFTVTVGGAEVELAAANPVSISGTAVTLTLAESVGGSLPAVTVGYAVPAANPLRDADRAKNPVPGFTGKTVANNTSGDTTPPRVSSAAIKGRTVTLTFNEALDESSVPGATQFPATIGAQNAGADSVRVAGKVVTLTYPSRARASHDDAVVMDYRNFRATHTPLRDLSENAVAEFIGRSVTNNTPPAFASAAVVGDALTVTFDGRLDPNSRPAADAFTVTVGGTRVALVDGDPVSISGVTVTVTLPVTVNSTQRVRMGYTAPAVNPLRDADRAKLPVAGFTGESVANNSPADSTPPVLLSASVNAVTLKLHYDEVLSATPLPEAGAFAVAVDGTAAALAATNPVSVSGRSVTLTLAAAVTARNAVTVGYTRPTGMGAKPIRDDVGNEAESFADVGVANETPAPLATIASVAIESAPSSGDTYALGEQIRVKVTWAAEVLWDVSGSGAALSVGLVVGKTARTARFATGSETRGRARALTFGYTVAAGDRDEDGIVIVRTAAHDVVALSGGATLKDAQGRDAVRGGTGEFGPAPGHKVDSSKPTPDKAPALVGATVSGKTLTLTFDEDLAAPADPEAASMALRMAFFVQGGRYQGAHVPNQSPTRVAIDGPTVTLTLGSGVGAGQAVTVEYGPDGITTHRLRGADGKEVESFVNRRVDNATGRAGPAPRLARATVEGSTLTLFFDRELDPNSQPAGSLFSVSGWSDGVPYNLRGTGRRARISGAVAVVMLDRALPTETVNNDKGEDVQAPDRSPAVRYVRRWSEPALRGTDGALVADIASWLARGLDGTGPAAAGGTVSGTKMTIYYEEALDERYVPAPAAFTVTLPGNETRAVQTVAVQGNAVSLTLDPAAKPIDDRLIVGVRYTASAAGAGRLRDMAGNEAGDHFVIIPTGRNLGTGEPAGKPALAETNPAVVDGDRLKLTFDQALDPTKVPRVEAFTLTVGWYAGFDDVKVNGPEVMLRLIGAMHPCEGAELNADGNIVPNDDIKLNYVTPTRNALGNRLGTQADNIVRAVVRNARANNDHCDEDGLEGAYRNSIILRGKRPFAQVAPPRAAWFTVTASGGPVTVTGAAFSPDDPYELKLTLSRELGPDETATVSYRRPAGARGLWNVDGQQLFDVVDLPVRMRAQDGAPGVEAVALVSDPGTDATYAAGDAIRVRVTFGAAVTVDTAQGTPRLKLDLGGEAGSGERWAAYASGSGTNTLAFVYEAVSGDASTGGVAVLADTLEANGGTLRSAAGADAALAHAGLAPDAGHKVDTDPPGFASAAVNGATLTVTFDEDLDAGSAPVGSAFTVTAAPAEGEARTIAGTGTAGVAGAAVTVTLAGAVAHGESLTVAYAPPDDGGLRDLAGNEAAAFSAESAENGTGAPAPAVEAVAVVSDPGEDATYAAGDAIRVQVTFGAAVTVDTAQGTPRLKLDLGGEAGSGERWAAYASGSGEAALIFAYTAVAGDASTGGVAVVADTLEANGGTLKSAAGAAAALTHAGLAPDAGHKVDANPPGFASAAVDGATLTVTFDEDLDAGSAPAGSAFTVTAAPADGEARAIAGTGTTGVAGAAVTVTLAGAVAHGETLTVAYAPPDENPVRDLAGNAAAAFSGESAENGTGAPAPAVEAVALVSDPGDDGTYAAGDAIRVQLTFGAPVTVDTAQGTPRLKLDLGGEAGERWASYASGSGTSELTFAYTAVAGDTSAGGVAVVADTLELDGGTIVSAAGADAALTHAGLNADPAHRVDANPPGFASASVDGATLTVTFDEDLDAGSAPAGSAFTVTAAPAGGEARTIAGTGTANVAGAAVTVTLADAVAHGETLTVAYAPPEENPVRDLAGNAAAAFSGESAENGTGAPAPAVEAVALVSDPGADATYAAGDAIRVQLTFGAAVTVDTAQGTPRLKLDLGGEAGERWASYASGDGTTALTFAYTAVSGDASAGGVAVVADTLELDGGTMVSAAGAAAALTHAGLEPDPAHRVDANPPAFASAAVDGSTLTLTFDEALDEAVAPAGSAFTVTAAPAEGEARAIAGTGTAGVAGAAVTVTLAGAAAHGETLSVAYAPPDEKPVRDLAGNAAAAFSGEAAVNGTGAPAPAVEAVALVSDPGTDRTYAAGDAIRVQVTFGAPVTVDTAQGTPRLKLDLGGEAGERWASYASGDGTTALTFAYTAVSGDASAGGVAVLADTLELDGGTMVSAAGAAAALAHAGLEPDPAHRVDANPPAFASAAVDGATLTLTFDEALDAGAVPAKGAFAVTADGNEADLAETGAVALSDAAVTLALAAAIAPGTPVRVSYAPPAAEGAARLRDAAGNAVAAFSGEPAANAMPAPAVTGVEVTSDAGPDGAYTEGETVEAAVTFSAPVTVGTEDGTPTLALIADGTIRRAPYASGSGTARLAFSYRVTKADGSLSAVRVAASGLKAGGGTIAGADGTPALLGFGAAPGVAASSIADEPDGSWGPSDTVEAVLRFAEPVTVTGAPYGRLVLVEGGKSAADRAVYAGGSGTDTLTFRHTLGEDGGSWTRAVLVSNSLKLDGGSIRSAGGGLAAGLEFVQAQRTLEPAAVPPAVTGVEVVSRPASGDTYGPGEAIRVRVTFGEAVAVDASGGTPRLKIKMDPGWGEFWAAYESGSGTDGLTFVHTVVEPNTAPTGIAVLANTLAANGGAIRSAASGADANLAHAGLGHDPAHKVDWRLAAPGPALTAAFHAVPGEHDGERAFSFGLTFSEEVKLSFRALKGPALVVANGRVTKAKRVAKGENRRWTITVQPASFEDVSVTLPATTDCAAPGAVCTKDGRKKLSNAVTATVLGPALLSVADARAREGIDAGVEFPVTLSRAASGTVTVDYATADGTAVAGEDYTATSGTLTFAAGEREKTVAVPILDDGHDEGEETFLFRLSNAQGARIEDGEATGTIENSDKMPKAWLARFGRTVAEQVVDSVQARLEAPRQAGAEATLGGQALPTWTPGSASGAGGETGGTAVAGLAGQEAAHRDAERLGRWLAGTDERDEDGREEDRGMTGNEVLAATAFSLTAAPEDGGPSVALWGRGASSSFSGRDGPLTVDGEVTSATLGADWRSGRWLAGAMVKHSLGEGSYSGDGGAGSVESTLTGIYPYAAYDVSGRLRGWAAAGYGEGTLTLTPENPQTGDDDPAMETDMALGMAALGAKGRLVEPEGSGFRLDLEADGFWVRTSSEKAAGLAKAKADVTRLRLGFDGGYAFGLEGGGTLEPTFELGLRHDGGDAETGWGVDIGGGLRWNDPALGLSGEVAGRGLLAHEAAGFKDRGVSGSLAWDPDPGSDRGPSLTLSQTLGAQAAGGADALLGRQTLADLAANDNGMTSRRLELRLGYGVPALGDRFTSTPEMGVALSDGGREYRLGWKLGLAPGGPSSFELGIEATRKEPANDAGSGTGAEPDHGVMLRGAARW